MEKTLEQSSTLWIRGHKNCLGSRSKAIRPIGIRAINTRKVKAIRRAYIVSLNDDMLWQSMGVSVRRSCRHHLAITISSLQPVLTQLTFGGSCISSMNFPCQFDMIILFFSKAIFRQKNMMARDECQGGV